MSVELVTHAYAEKLPQYAVFLRAQLSSIYLNTMEDVKISVCYTPTDAAVCKVLEDLSPWLKENLIQIPLPKKELFRRSIGRNIAALNCKADIFWATDVDHYFGRRCLSGLMNTWRGLGDNLPTLVWPKVTQIQKTHDLGDRYCKDYEGVSQPLIEIDPSEFTPTQNRKAIGGIQITSGAFARKHGYLNLQFVKWRQPAASESIPFPSFSDDVKFRKVCEQHGECRAIDIQGLYRLRHTETTYK